MTSGGSPIWGRDDLKEDNCNTEGKKIKEGWRGSEGKIEAGGETVK